MSEVSRSVMRGVIMGIVFWQVSVLCKPLARELGDGSEGNVFPFARTSVTPSLPQDGRKSTRPDKLPAGAIYI